MSGITPNLRSIVNEDGAVILDIPRDRMVTLNPTGGYIWDRLSRGKTIEETARDLAAETHANLAEVESDIRVFMEELMSNHLFERQTNRCAEDWQGL